MQGIYITWVAINVVMNYLPHCDKTRTYITLHLFSFLATGLDNSDGANSYLLSQGLVDGANSYL